VEQTGRKKDQRAHKLQNAMDGNSRQPEWQQKEPNDRIRHNGDQGQRPAENQQKTPEKKLRHTSPTLHRSGLNRVSSTRGAW
jgi:hypothetical protein